jgi:thioredoxin-like negative regulator of GroEL
LVRAGRRAFAAGESGRAAEIFRLAIATAPEIGSAYFLLAQAQLALGKYHDAVASIHQGLAKQPDWPTAGPPLSELYAGDAGALAEHERQLDEAAAARPDDPALDFLRAYVRWFDGRRDEARALFRQVRERVTRQEAVDRFLQPPGA